MQVNDQGDDETFTTTFDAPNGQIIAGVCISSGSNMFGGTGHSGVLGNGTFESGCYTVSGVGTSSLTVARNFSGPGCQGISHLDVVVEGATPTPSPTPTPTPTPTATPTPTGIATPTPTVAAATPTPTALGVVQAPTTPTPAVAGVVSRARALPVSGDRPGADTSGLNAMMIAGAGGILLGGVILVLARRREI